MQYFQKNYILLKKILGLYDKLLLYYILYIIILQILKKL